MQYPYLKRPMTTTEKYSLLFFMESILYFVVLGYILFGEPNITTLNFLSIMAYLILGVTFLVLGFDSLKGDI